jgi:hypothetical protein
MRLTWWRRWLFGVMTAVKVGGVFVAGIVGAVLRTTPTNWSAPISAWLKWAHENGWWLIVVCSVAAAVATLINSWMGPPWVWRSVQKLLDKLRDEVFDIADEEGVYAQRVTLFRRHRFLWWIWPWRRWFWPWGSWRCPWSGWLVPVARSGHTTQKSRAIYLAPDDADNAEGIAGQAWVGNCTIRVIGLPDLNGESGARVIREYARQTFVSETWLRRRIKAKKACPRALCGFPVEVNRAIWGVIVLDSRRPDSIKLEAGQPIHKLFPIAIGEILQRA